jgi:hypothetical protein
MHAAATVFFATFNGSIYAYEHEQEKRRRGTEKGRMLLLLRIPAFVTALALVMLTIPELLMGA